MLKNYFKIAWRNLWKNKVFSAINVFGLTVGLTCCLLIAVYIQHELSYDNFQLNGKRIARVIMEYSMNGTVNKGNYTSTKVAPSFKRNFPEVKAAVRMLLTNRIIKYEEKLFDEKRFMYADSTFFELFSFKLVKGNPRYALSGPNKILLSEAAVKKYFAHTDPIGKTIGVTSNATGYEVTGVIQDCPSNSQMKFDFLASFSSLGVAQETTYWNANYTTYVLLNNEASFATLQAKIPGFMKKEMGDETSGNDYLTYYLEPFKRIHLYSEYEGFEPNNSITYIYIVSVIALLILFIACFTYINLSTARSMERAKEVGIRKVAGAFRKQIFWQFICESIVISVIALFFSLGLCVLLLPAFNKLAERELLTSSLFSPFTVVFCLGIVILISLCAGSYPALILSRLQPIKVLKGAFKNTGSALWLRKSLIVFQFVISVFLIIATFIVQDQLHYIQSKNLGYNREHIMVLPLDQKILAILPSLKTEFKLNTQILNVSKAVNAPTYIKGGYNMRTPEMPENKQLFVNANPVDEDYIKTSGIKIIAGSDLSSRDIEEAVNPEEGKQLFHFILNESAVAALGYKPIEAVGKKMFLGNQRPGIIKGVVKDFNFTSLHNPIKPLVLFPDTWANVLMVKVSGYNMQETVAYLQTKWKALVPHRPFEFHFLDDDYNKLYGAELRIGKVLNLFAFVAMLLAILGLFGLSAYTIQQRTKEIGIRKVLGASMTSLVALLSKDFLKLVALAAIIAFPIAWYTTVNWLQSFSYRVNIGWLVFVIAGSASVIIALATISVEAIRAASANPVKNLRTE